MRVAPLTEDLLGAWAALFEACGCACFCRYWHFEGTKNEWLARSFEDPARNRDEQSLLVARGAPEARGLLALDGDLAVGWMKLAPRALLPKLRRQGAYRALDLGDDEGVWSIGCFLVRRQHRRHSVARTLVDAAPDYVRRWGGRALEAYPHRVSHPPHDEEAWMGPESLFVSPPAETTDVTKRWQVVHDLAPYPVYRLNL